MRAGRLLQLVLILQDGRRHTAQQLAEELQVSGRTVLRDLEALSAASVPVYATRGPGGGFQLLDTFRRAVPPPPWGSAHLVGACGGCGCGSPPPRSNSRSSREPRRGGARGPAPPRPRVGRTGSRAPSATTPTRRSSATSSHSGRRSRFCCPWRSARPWPPSAAASLASTGRLASRRRPLGRVVASPMPPFTTCVRTGRRTVRSCSRCRAGFGAAVRR